MTPKAKGILRGAVVAAGLSLIAAAAHAAPATAVPKGNILVGAERLFGLSVNRVTTDTSAGDTSLDQTHFGLFLANGTPVPNVYLVPRLALDFALADGLTLGGSIGFLVSDYDTSATNGSSTVEADGPTITTLLLSPRVGYVLGIGRIAGLWLRGGFTYFRSAVGEDTDGNATSSETNWGLAIDLEPTLLLTPFEHFGFTVSFNIDLPLAGKRTVERTVGPVTTSTSVDQRIRNIGLTVGMVGVF
jgi:hypothetical protein